MEWHDMLYIQPYKLGSASAKALAQGLGVLRIRGTKRLGRYAKVINWGSTSARPYSRWGAVPVINKPEAVARAANKLRAFETLTAVGIPTVPWTTNAAYAQTWRELEGVVVARRIVSGSGGDGISIITPMDNWVHAPLYTKYVSKCHEYRVHVAFGKVIDFSKKRRRNDVPVNEYVRNYGSGWVFCREGATLPELVKSVCIRSVAALGLDFGAVDILYKEKDNKCYVLETNSAPGLQASTLTAYLNIFQEVARGRL